jgi:hypothetical protein
MSPAVPLPTQKPAGMSQWEWAMIVRGRGMQERYGTPNQPPSTPSPATPPTVTPTPTVTTTTPTPTVASTTSPETPSAVRLRVATDIVNQLRTQYGLFVGAEGLANYLKNPNAQPLTFNITGATVTVPVAEFEKSIKDYEVAYAKYQIDQITQITTVALKAIAEQSIVKSAVGERGVELLRGPSYDVAISRLAAGNIPTSVSPTSFGVPNTRELATQHLRGILATTENTHLETYQKIAAIQKGIVYPSDIPTPYAGTYYGLSLAEQKMVTPKTAAQTFEEGEARLNDYLLHGTSLSYRLGEAFDIPVIRDIVRGGMRGVEDITNIPIAMTGVTLPQPINKTIYGFESPVGVKGISVAQPSQLETLAEYAGQMVAFQGILTAGRVIAEGVIEGTQVAILKAGAGTARAIGMPAEMVSAVRDIANVRMGGTRLGLEWTFIGRPVMRDWGLGVATLSHEGGLLAPFIEPFPWSIIKETPTFTKQELMNLGLGQYAKNLPAVGAEIDMTAYELIRPAGLVETTTVTEKIAGTNLAFDERLGGYFKVPAGGESGLFVTTTEQFAALEKSVFVEKGTLDRILNFQLESGQFGITAPYTTPLKITLKTELVDLETLVKPALEITEVSQREVFNLGNRAIATTTRWYPIAPEGLADLTDIGWISRQDLLATYRSKSWIDLEVVRDQLKYLGEQPVLDLTKEVAPGAIHPSLGKTVYTFARTDLSILDMTKDFAKIESDTLGFGAIEYVPKQIAMVKPDWSLRIGGKTHTPWTFPTYDVLQGAERIFPSVAEEIPTAPNMSLAETISKTARGLNQIVLEEAPIVFPAVETSARDIIGRTVAGAGLIAGSFPTIKIGAMSNIGAEMNRRTNQPIALRLPSVEEPTLKDKDIAKLIIGPVPETGGDVAQKTMQAVIQATITVPKLGQITTPDFQSPPPTEPDFVPIIPPFESSVYMFWSKKQKGKRGGKKYGERLWQVGPIMPKFPKLNAKATRFPSAKQLGVGTIKMPKVNTVKMKIPKVRIPKIKAIKVPRMKKMRRLV